MDRIIIPASMRVNSSSSAHTAPLQQNVKSRARPKNLIATEKSHPSMPAPVKPFICARQARDRPPNPPPPRKRILCLSYTKVIIQGRVVLWKTPIPLPSLVILMSSRHKTTSPPPNPTTGQKSPSPHQNHPNPAPLAKTNTAIVYVEDSPIPKVDISDLECFITKEAPHV